MHHPLISPLSSVPPACSVALPAARPPAFPISERQMDVEAECALNHLLLPLTVCAHDPLLPHSFPSTGRWAKARAQLTHCGQVQRLVPFIPRGSGRLKRSQIPDASLGPFGTFLYFLLLRTQWNKLSLLPSTSVWLEKRPALTASLPRSPYGSYRGVLSAEMPTPRCKRFPARTCPAGPSDVVKVLFCSHGTFCCIFNAKS